MSTVCGLFTSPSMVIVHGRVLSDVRVAGRVVLVEPELVEVVVGGDVRVGRAGLVRVVGAGALRGAERRQRAAVRDERVHGAGALHAQQVEAAADDAGRAREEAGVPDELAATQVQLLGGDLGAGGLGRLLVGHGSSLLRANPRTGYARIRQGRCPALPGGGLSLGSQGGGTGPSILHPPQRPPWGRRGTRGAPSGSRRSSRRAGPTGGCAAGCAHGGAPCWGCPGGGGAGRCRSRRAGACPARRAPPRRPTGATRPPRAT